MSEKSAELWVRAEDCTESPAEIEATLRALNRDLDWDRDNLSSETVVQREPLQADD